MNESVNSHETSSEEYQTLISSFAQAFWETDARGMVVTDSPSWRAYTGQSLQEWLGEGWASAVHPDDQAYALSQWQEAAGQLWPVNAEFRLQRPGGGWRWTNVRATPILHADGSVKKWLGINIDIQEKKEAEAALQQAQHAYQQKLEQQLAEQTRQLQENQALLRATLDSTLEMIQVFRAVRNESGEIIDFIWTLNNQSSERQYGDVIGKSLLTLNPGVKQAGIFDTFKRVCETGVADQSERHYIHEQFKGWFDQSTVKLGDGVATTTTNITARKQAEAELESTKELLQTVLDSTPFIIQAFHALRDGAGRIVDFAWIMNNERGVRQNGEVMGQSLLSRNPGVVETGLFEKFVQVTETGLAIEHEQYYSHEQFKGQWFHQTLIKMGDGFVMTTEDISERKRAEQELKASKDLVQTVFDVSLNPIAYHKAVRDENGIIVDFEFQLENQQARKYALKNRRGQRYSEAYPGIKDTLVFKLYKDVVETGTELNTEVQITLKGVDRWFHVMAAKLNDGLVATAVDITQRRTQEQENLRLKDEIATLAQDRYRTLFNSIAEGFSIIELIFEETGQAVDYRFIEVNQAYVSQTGQADPTGKLGSEVIPGTEDYWLEAYQQVIATGEPVFLENYNDHSKRWYKAYASRIGGSGSHDIAVVFEDITERKQRLEKQAFLLRFSDALRTHATADEVANQALRLLIEQLQLDRSYITTYHLDENRATLDYQIGNDTVPPLPDYFVLSDYPEAFKAVHGQTFIIEDDYERQGLTETEQQNSKKLGMRAMLASTVRMGQSRPLSSLMAISSRPRRWTPSEIKLVEEVAERTWSALEKVRIEETLQKTEERTRLAIEAANLATWEWDLITNEVHWNKQHFELLGMNIRPNPLPAEVFMNHLHPDDADSIKAQLQKAIDERSLYDAEFRVIREDGMIRWMSGYGRVTVEGNGHPLQASGIMFDITERKEAQRALEESETRLSAIFESLPVGIGVVNKQGRITHCNKEMEYFVPTGLMPSMDENQRNRWQAHDEQGRPIPPENFPGARALRGERVLPPIEMLYTPAVGNQIWTHVSAVPIRTSEGVISGPMVVISNINELKRAERVLKENDQRKNEFLAMLAHELRNPMATLRNGLQILSITVAANAQAKPVLEMMTRQTEHLVRMVDDLLDISRISQGKIELRKTRINLVELLKQARESIQMVVQQKQQQLTFRLPAMPVELEGDATRLVQLTMNLLTNASRYTPAQGKIHLSLEHRDIRPSYGWRIRALD